MRPPYAARSFLAAAISLALAGPAAASDDLPRYAFVPGQSLVYEGDEGAATSSGRFGVERRTILHVVRINPDGSRRLLVDQRYVRYSVRGGARSDDHVRVDVYVVDVTPDGRIADRTTDTFDVLNRLLPELPRDQRAATDGWRFVTGDVTHECRMLEDEGPDAWSFEIAPTSVMMSMNENASAATYELDRRRGIVTRISTRYTHAGRPTRTGAETLVDTRAIDPESIALLADEIDVYDAAIRAYKVGIDEVIDADEPALAPPRLDALLADLERTHEALRHDLLREQLARTAAQHRRAAGQYAERAARLAQFLNEPAPPWSARELGGAMRSLSDYRGRVVILDFWYRRCGWCIRAMPQIQAVARRFAGKPVAVLGMNVDRDVEDAQYVVERVGIEYPTLLSDRDVARAYGVGGYPTLVVVDQTGVIRHVHVGYSGTLAEELAALVDELLAE